MQHTRSFFGSLICGLLIVYVDSQPYMQHAMGPQLCKHLCSTTIGCTSYTYVPDRLSCCIEINSCLSQESHKGIFHGILSQNNMCLNLSAQCEQTSRIFYTKRKFLKCSNVSSRHQRIKTLPKNSLQLLIADKSDLIGEFYIYFPNKSPQHCKKTPEKCVHCMTFISKTELIIARCPSMVYIYNLDTTFVRVLMNTTAVVALDQNKHSKYLYMISTFSNAHGARRSTLWKMRKNDTHVQHVRDLREKQCFQIELHLEEKTIYMSCGNSIYACGFDGLSQRPIFRGSTKHPISFDKEHGILYYGEFNTVNMIKLPSLSRKKVISLRFPPTSIIYHGNKFYL